MNTKDGGPAFPARPTEQLAGGISITTHHGMSLRDYFAAMAMPCFLSSILGTDQVDKIKRVAMQKEKEVNLKFALPMACLVLCGCPREDMTPEEVAAAVANCERFKLQPHAERWYGSGDVRKVVCVPQGDSLDAQP